MTRASSCLARALPLTFALGLALPLGAQQKVDAKQPAYALEMARVSLVPTPNFVGMTLGQARAMATVASKVKGGKPISLFSSISPSEPVDGVVISQYPPANMAVYPGRIALTLTLQPPEPPKTPWWGPIVQGMLPPKAESTIVPPLYGDSCESAAEALKARRLTIRCSGEANGVVAQQIPQPKSSVAVNSQVIVILRLPMAVVPPIENLTVAAASQRLELRSLQLGSVSGGRKGVALPIVSQYPDAGASVPVGSSVDVTLQTPTVLPPKLTVMVPYLEEKSRAEALGILNGVDLQLGNTVEGAPGVVIGQFPSSGTPVSPGSAVEITLSGPPPRVAVPPLGGLTRAQVLSALDRVDLQLGGTYGDAGVVTRQRPAAGTMVAPNALVDIVLAMPQTVAPPQVPQNTTATGLPPEAVATGLVPATPAVPTPTAPPWGWIAVVVVLEAVGVVVVPHILNALFPAAVVTMAAHSNTVEAGITSKIPAGVQFTVCLRDQPVTATYRSVREPEILEKGRHP